MYSKYTNVCDTIYTNYQECFRLHMGLLHIPLYTTISIAYFKLHCDWLFLQYRFFIVTNSTAHTNMKYIVHLTLL